MPPSLKSIVGYRFIGVCSLPHSPGFPRGLEPAPVSFTKPTQTDIRIRPDGVSNSRSGCSPNSTGGNSGNDKVQEGSSSWCSARRFACGYQRNDSSFESSTWLESCRAVRSGASRQKGERKARLQGSEFLQGQGWM
jgi:hypothetical protein